LRIDAGRRCRTIVNRLEELFFSFSPSFYAIISGALIGTATNLLTSLIFIQEGSLSFDIRLIKISILSIYISSACFAYVSLTLEQIRGQVKESDDATKKKRLLNLISGHRNKLWLSTIIGLISITLGAVLVSIPLFDCA